jgi:hypothetical protein
MRSKSNVNDVGQRGVVDVDVQEVRRVCWVMSDLAIVGGC